MVCGSRRRTRTRSTCSVHFDAIGVQGTARRVELASIVKELLTLGIKLVYQCELVTANVEWSGLLSILNVGTYEEVMNVPRIGCTKWRLFDVSCPLFRATSRRLLGSFPSRGSISWGC